jgi:sulfate adenylyltransferase subunit 2
MNNMKQNDNDYLDFLEAEAISILREAAGQFERPALLFSGGKDSITLVRLAEKAFRPGTFPFPLLHIDTGHNFEEVLQFRDALATRLKEKLIVRSVEKTISEHGITEEDPRYYNRNSLQTHTLLSTIREFGFDACIGGARRDEEKARAKERIFSLRDTYGRWDPKKQRPELWNILNGRIRPGEHVRVFPISNWSELDVWRYIERERLELPSIYFAHKRLVVDRDGKLVSHATSLAANRIEVGRTEQVRFRTVGDMSCTAAVKSEAGTIAAIIEEIEQSNISERGETRLDDAHSETSMEDRKREGYF